MAKSSGITTTVSVDDAGGTARDISADIESVEITTSRNSVDITGLDKSAVERLLLLADAQVRLTMTFNPATNAQHDVFKTSTSTSVARTVTIVFNSTPTATLAMEMIITDYSFPRGADGAIKPTATLMLQSGTAPTWT